MPTPPLVAIEAPDGVRSVFTFAADIALVRTIVVDRFVEGETIDFNVTGTRQITFTAGNIPPPSGQIWLLNGFLAASVGTSLPTWDTVANLISDAAIELGIAPNAAPIANPFAATDPNILQLLAYLKSGGRDLAKRRQWAHLQKEFTFPTVNGQIAYPLPSDYRSLVPNSGWNRTTQWPLGGPVGAEFWQFRKATVFAGTVFLNVRIWQGQMFFEPTPTSAQTIAFEYLSSSWIMPSGQTAPTSSTPAAATDTVCFEPNLVVKRLRLDFQRAKHFDTTTEQDDYDDALYAAELEDSPARTIYLGGRANRTPKRIDRWNIPDTGVGQ